MHYQASDWNAPHISMLSGLQIPFSTNLGGLRPCGILTESRAPPHCSDFRVCAPMASVLIMELPCKRQSFLLACQLGSAPVDVTTVVCAPREYQTHLLKGGPSYTQSCH